MSKDSSLYAVVFVHHGLGDLLMSLPLLRALRDVSPSDGRIAVFVKSPKEAEILHLAQLDGRFYIAPLQRTNILRVALALRRQKCALFLTPHATRDWRMPLLARLIGARISVGPHSPWAFLGYTETVPAPHNIHKVEYYLKFLESVQEIRKQKPDVRLMLPESLKMELSSRFPQLKEKARWVALSPGSGQIESHKRWPAVHFAELGKRLLHETADVRLIVLGSPEERYILQDIQQRINNNERCFTVAPEKILDAFGLLENASCLVSNCSGQSHMAASVGIPIIGMYGPTNPGFTGPYSQKLRVVRLHLPCSPCYRAGFIKGCGQPICMTHLPVENVFKAVIKTLRGDAYPPIPFLKTTRVTQLVSPYADKTRN